MGGDNLHCFASEDESSLENDYPQFPCNSPTYRRGEDELDSNEFNGFSQVGHGVSSNSLELDCNLRRRKLAYNEIMKSYDELWVRREDLVQAKGKILRYTPGSWISNVGSDNLGNYAIPKTTTLLLVGPKGSGKSSLVNRISRVFEDDKFASERAQVTYNSSSGEGTFFLEEYMMRRGGSSFCLFDTRSLSENFTDNEEMLRHWIIEGVCHGELVIRDSDSSNLRKALECKARKSGSPSSEIKKVNFVIFVVNGFSVLRAMNSNKEEDKSYMKMVVETFNSPYLSFKDDKPVVAVTHGDLLSLGDRARVCIYLGEKLGVPPAKQIFDIPDNSDLSTELTIIDMIRYSLEHADKNLPCRERRECMNRNAVLEDNPRYKVLRTSVLTFLFLAILLVISHLAFQMSHPDKPQAHFTPFSSLLQQKIAATHSHERQEPKITPPPASVAKSGVTKSALTSPLLVEFPRKKHRSLFSKRRHPKSAIKWHKIRHIW